MTDNDQKVLKRKLPEYKRDPKKTYMTLCVPVERLEPQEVLYVIAECEDSEQEAAVDFWDDEYGQEIQETIDETFGKEVFELCDVIERKGPTKDSDFDIYPVVKCPKPKQ